MRTTVLGLIAATAIVTSMSSAAMAQTGPVRPHRHAQATAATRDAYGAYYQEPGVVVAPSWSANVHAGNHTEQFDDPRVLVNGN